MTPLLLSLLTLGFFGGFTHCSSMCGPFVLTQVGNRLQKTSLNNFSTFTKLKHLALLPYHLGRITTYSFIGFFCSLFSNEIFHLNNFRFISAGFLLIATLFFVNILFDGKLNLNLNIRKIITFLRPLKKPTKKDGFFKNFMAFLFKNPRGLNGYLLGIILGFIPCGMLYGAFLISATIPSPLMAAFGMLLFGVATFPALFLTASGSYFFLRSKIINFSYIMKIMALANIAMLLMMTYKLIS